MSWGVSPWVYPVWDPLGFLDLSDYFLPHFREVFNYFLLKYFLMVFLIIFFFWDSYDSNVVAFNIVLEVSEIVFISFNSFFFFPPWFTYFYILSSTSLILSSASVILLFVASKVFLITFIALFIIYWLFFKIYWLFKNFLVKPFLHLLNPCLQAIYLWFHFDFKILDHFHYHYSEFFIR